MSDAPQITDNREARRLELVIDGQMAELTYRVVDGQLVLDHTGVPPAIEGRGHGGRLVEAAVDKAEAEHLEIVPSCSFTRAWLQRNPRHAERVRVA
jgi:predicted GNAT family acetyltransferase